LFHRKEMAHLVRVRVRVRVNPNQVIHRKEMAHEKTASFCEARCGTWV